MAGRHDQTGACQHAFRSLPDVMTRTLRPLLCRIFWPLNATTPFATMKSSTGRVDGHSRFGEVGDLKWIRDLKFSFNSSHGWRCALGVRGVVSQAQSRWYPPGTAFVTPKSGRPEMRICCGMSAGWCLESAWERRYCLD